MYFYYNHINVVCFITFVSVCLFVSTCIYSFNAPSGIENAKYHVYHNTIPFFPIFTRLCIEKQPCVCLHDFRKISLIFADFNREIIAEFRDAGQW